MTPRDRRIMKDLADNMREKIMRNIHDYTDLCVSAGLDEKEATTEAMCFLIRLTAAFAAHRFNVSPADFAQAMGKQYQDILRAMAEDEK